MRRSNLLAVAAVAAVLAGAANAGAYCRTTVCDGERTGYQCSPPTPDGSDCGIPLAWPEPCVGYSIHEDASSQVTLAQTEEAFQKAFAAWMTADCGGATHPRMIVTYAGPVACGAHEYNQDKGNANIIAYRDGGWPHPNGESTLALTTVTYNLDNGQIYDADMELNTAQVQFTVSTTEIGFDLQSVATHEAGHFLGLSHTPDMMATMYSGYPGGHIELRTLEPDDVAGICAAYPPGAPATSCDPTPRHGFSGECAEDQEVEDDGCAVTAPGAGTGASLAPAALLLLAAARRRRRAPPAT